MKAILPPNKIPMHVISHYGNIFLYIINNEIDVCR